MREPFLSLTIEPRFYETDALGHINNVAIAGWMELGRTQVIERLAAGEVAVPPESWVVVSLLVEFVAETFYGEAVTLKVTELGMGNTSLTVASELWQGGKLTVRGRAVLVHRNPATGAKQAIPEAMRRQL